MMNYFKEDNILLQYNIYVYDRKINGENRVLVIVEPKYNDNKSKTYAHISFLSPI